MTDQNKPLFVQPEPEEPPSSSGDSITVELDPEGGNPVLVMGFERELPDPASTSDRAKLVKAGLGNDRTSLSEDAWYAVARAAVHADAVAVQLRHQAGARGGMLIEEHVDGALLRSVHARTWLTELFPAVQPRTGEQPLALPDPEILGELDESGRPRAVLCYRYRDMDHLRRYLRQTVAATRRANRDPYDQSILARRITRAVIAHPVRICFDDDTEPFHVLAVRDGITRLTSAWAVLSGETGPEEIADAAADALLARAVLRRGTAPRPLGQLMAQGRADRLAEFQAEFRRGVLGHHPTEQAVRIGQTLVVPAQITVGVQAYQQEVNAPAEVFDDAIRSILASIHVEFKPWEPAAKNVEVGTRALKRLVLDGDDFDTAADVRGIYDLAVGRIESAALAEVSGALEVPGTALWRAVLLVHFLTRPQVYDRFKQVAKQIKGVSRMPLSGYAELLGPIIDLPWRETKQDSLRQARNAWANGGVVFEELKQTAWSPAPCKDFTELVRPAQQGDDDARFTLAVAGGTALIADKILTRNVGSAVGRTVPFRSNVNVVIAGLARRENTAGLWLLALAANAFDPDRVAVNALTGSQLSRLDESRAAYTVPDVDPRSPDGVARDAVGAPVQLTTWRAVSASAPERVEQESAATNAPGANTLTPQELIARDRAALRSKVEAAWEAVQNFDGRAAEAGMTSPWSLFGSRDEWEKIYDPVKRAEAWLYAHQVPGEREEEEEADDAGGEADDREV